MENFLIFAQSTQQHTKEDLKKRRSENYRHFRLERLRMQLQKELGYRRAMHAKLQFIMAVRGVALRRQIMGQHNYGHHLDWSFFL